MLPDRGGFSIMIYTTSIYSQRVIQARFPAADLEMSYLRLRKIWH